MPRPKSSASKSPSTQSKTCSRKTKPSPSRQTPSSKRTTSSTRQETKKTSPSTQASNTNTKKRSTTKSSGTTTTINTASKRKSPSSQKRAPSTKAVKKPSPVKKNLKTQQKKPSVKTTTPRKRKVLDEIKVSNSRNKSLFPWIETFPYFLDDQTENKRCWFVCQEHAEKYIRRYNPKYKLYCYTGKRG